MSCAIWGTEATEHPRTGDVSTYDSPRAGGLYAITGSAEALVANLEPQVKARITTWLIDQHRQGVSAPKLDAETIEWLTTLPPSSVTSRVDRLLLWLSKRTKFAGERVRILDGPMALEMFAWSESLNQKELWFLLETLGDNGSVEAQSHSGGFDAKIVIGGYERLSELTAREVMSSQGFVAMWFGDDMTEVYDHGIAPGIVDAGYRAMRIDRKPHNNKIDDEIIAEIRRSKFLVADFTHGSDGARGGVYYEAGFAHGLDIPVIFAVREDQGEKTHFDTRQYAHIRWKDVPDLRKQLADRISATLGDGPNKARS